MRNLSGLRALGVFAAFARDPIRCMERISRWPERAIRVEPPLPWRRGAPPVLVLIGPEFNRQVLMATDRLRPTGIWPVRAPADSSQESLRYNYLTMHGDEHQRVTAAISPHFDRERIESHFAATKRIVRWEVERWPVGETVDVHELLRELAQHLAFALMFGETDVARIQDFGSQLAKYHAANWSRMAALIRLDLPAMPYRRVLRRAEELQAFIADWIARSGGRGRPENICASLFDMSAGHCGGISPARAAAVLASLALASYETTTTTLTWTLVLLARNPAIMAALVEEVSAAGAVESVDLQALDALPLLDAVLKETLRLIPPVPILGFRTTRACELGGFDLPEAATVMLSPQLTHRLPELYDEPDRFWPERWFHIRPSTYEYLPFSGGPRRCPGYLFATYNMKLALATILERWHISLTRTSPIGNRYRAVTAPRRSVEMRFRLQR